MNFLLTILRFCVLIAFASVFSHASIAADAAAKPAKGYGRINFAFAAPAKLSANVAGTTATLKFSAPLTQSPQAITAALPGYVTHASVSADKRTLTLTLSKPYRIRQFVSGSNVGVDLVGEAIGSANTPSPEKKSEPAAKEKPKAEVKKAETVKPTAKKEAKKEVKKETKKSALAKAKPAEKKKPAQKPATKMKTETEAPKTKASAEKPSAAPATKPAPAEDPILSTKHENPAPVATPEKPAPTKTSEPLLSTKTTPAVATAPEKADPILTTKDATSKPKAAVAEPPKAEEKPTAAATTPAPTKDDPADVAETAPATTSDAANATNAAPTPAKKQTGPFIVGTRTINDQTAIHFPWTERTAAAVLTRGQDIWVVFSQAQTVNIGLLRSVMPKQVINITQYPYKDTTILRLTTDGNLNAYATQTKGNYGWDILFSSTPEKAAIDTPLSVNNLDDTMRLVATAFDMAPAIRFYDPTIGDQLIILPAYENGRGVATERNFPEFSILQAPQGIVIATNRDDLEINTSRIGLIITGKNGLAISKNLPTVGASSPIKPTVEQGVIMPYDEWYVPQERMVNTLSERLISVGNATKDAKPESLMNLARAYLSFGQCPEATGLLTLIAQSYPDYYRSNHLALISGACHILMQHMDDANTALAAPELNDLNEATLWREVAALFTPQLSTTQIVQQVPPPTATDAAANPASKPEEPAPSTPAAVTAEKPVFHFLKFNKPFIRHYPPAVRQRLAVIAADAYIADAQPEKALAVFDSLIRDGIVAPVELNAEFTLGIVAVHKKQYEQAYEIFDRLATQHEDRYIAARARYEAAKLRYTTQKISLDEAIDIIEQTRLTWRGDALEREMLDTLILLYREAKRYDDILRTKKNLLDAFPNAPDYLKISGEMSELFEQIYLDGLANEMDPLKALGLFYEFRDLTPLGEKGDKIIQLLANRLAAIDLLDRAIQLLDHQLKFRATGDARTHIGAKLALLHLLNKQPQEALNVLEVSNFGGNQPELQIKRQQLAAEALLNLGKNEEAIGILVHDNTPTGALLRLNILWAMRDWPSIINQGEDILSARPNLTDPLTPQETELLLKLALAYSFEGDLTQLRYLKDYYTNLIPDSATKQIFAFITNDTTPLDAEDFDMVAKQISHTESFLGIFREKIAAGKLSEALP